MPTCPSCHQENPEGAPFCESCGAALPENGPGLDDDDDVLSLMLGLVCPNCDSYNDPGTTSCVLCDHALGDEAPAGDDPAPAQPTPEPAAPAGQAGAPPSWMQAPEGSPLATANAMPAVDLKVLREQQGGGLSAPAGSEGGTGPLQPSPGGPGGDRQTPAALPASPVDPVSVCSKCQGETRPDDKFCRHCGQRLDAGAPAAGTGPAGTMMIPSLQAAAAAPAAEGAGPGPSATMFFGAASVERFARLTLVKGHTQFGTQWRLQAGETVIGRESGLVLFPDDPYMAARHCRVEFRGEDLWIVPEDEKNGVFVRIHQPESLPFGGEFVMGVQRLKLIGPNELPRADEPTSDGTDTQFLGSSFKPGAFAVKRVFQEPNLEEVYFRPQRVLAIGRARCDVNFPEDPFMSTRHAQLTRTSTGASLEDLGSRNGTFLRLHQERKLAHGDVIMLGEQVLRVELSLSLSRG